MSVDGRLLEELRGDARAAFDEMGTIRMRVDRVHEAMQIFPPDGNEHRTLNQKSHELEVEWNQALFRFMDAQRRFTDLLDHRPRHL